MKYPKRDHAGRLSVWMLDASAPTVPHQPQAPVRGQQALVDTAKPTLKRIMETQRTYGAKTVLEVKRVGGPGRVAKATTLCRQGRLQLRGVSGAHRQIRASKLHRALRKCPENSREKVWSFRKKR